MGRGGWRGTGELGGGQGAPRRRKNLVILAGRTNPGLKKLQNRP